MENITIRNIPDDVFAKIKRLSAIEKRSMNSEVLVIIERGTNSAIEETMKRAKHIPASIQKNLWMSLTRTWEDRRSMEEILEDIYGARTTGREFKL
ncbi:hypothetical protein ES708_08156 [subsurface metagenome]